MRDARVRRTVVLSDVHLSQAHPEGDGDERWMRYRRRDLHPDADFARLVDLLLEQRTAGTRSSSSSTATSSTSTPRG